jgi:hypothetical protein
MEIIVPHTWDLREAFLVEVEPLRRLRGSVVDLQHWNKICLWTCCIEPWRTLTIWRPRVNTLLHVAWLRSNVLEVWHRYTMVYHGDPRYTHYISILRVLAWVSLWVWFDSSFCHWKGLRWCYLRFEECLQQCCFGEHHVRPRDVMHAPTLGLVPVKQVYGRFTSICRNCLAPLW